MWVVVILLLLANLAFFGYTRLDTATDGEAIRLVEQVQPEKIKLLTPQQVAALGPAKVAALADVCLEWGPLGDADRARALAELEPLALGKTLTQRKSELAMTHWIYMTAPSRVEAERRVADAKTRGVAEASVAELSPQRYGVSLGAFRDEDAAKARLAEIVQLGLINARSAPRQQSVTQTTFVIRDPQSTTVAKIRDLAGSYRGSEAKVGSCERS